ncbi:very short patch repair endonuclease [Stenotrophomonas geniculata]|uniref:very short patch repair endonuclease n=1 Tax=Stenotrophomonas geniculata TaxID=86188 RepID=UPI003137EFE7
MIDSVSRSKRSLMMAGIRGKGTRPELLVRKFLHQAGFRYRLNVARLPGAPDLVLVRHRVAVFVHGCFWHRHLGCRYAATPATRPEFWIEKFDSNRKRDQLVQERLLETGWRVAIVWECALKNSTGFTLNELRNFINSNSQFIELSWGQETNAE